MRSHYWKLPRNWEELVAEVKWAAGGSLSLEVKAPLTVTAELAEQKDRNRLLVHLLNYDCERNPTVANIEVSLRLPPGKQVTSVTILSPDAEHAMPASVRSGDGRAVFAIPLLRTYSAAVVTLR